tara:strand:- start:170 stop:361 length:192 start_codon:yes stop_codon:yes gene_type:complete
MEIEKLDKNNIEYLLKTIEIEINSNPIIIKQKKNQNNIDLVNIRLETKSKLFRQLTILKTNNL